MQRSLENITRRIDSVKNFVNPNNEKKSLANLLLVLYTGPIDRVEAVKGY